jgi:hypothetical protein
MKAEVIVNEYDLFFHLIIAIGDKTYELEEGFSSKEDADTAKLDLENEMRKEYYRIKAYF